ncbi:MAG: reverse transcriptase domain-containing protein [Sedimenticola sp.]
MENKNVKLLKLATLNVKNVETNNQYLLNVLKSSDVVCLQETWLFAFQLEQLNQLDENFESQGKAVDDNDPIPPVQKPRGYGGVANLTRTNSDLKFRKCNDGSNRIVVTEMLSNPPVCLCNVYMPARNSRTSQSYSEILDELSEIISKYKSTHAIIVLGDMNASLITRKGNEQDILFKQFCEKENLHTNQFGEPTFFHENGRDCAELDYVLCCEKALTMIESTEVESGSHSSCNTSDHKAVTAVLKIKVHSEKRNPVIHKTKPKWDKCDKAEYTSYIEENLRTFDRPESEFEMIQTLGHFSSILKEATSHSIPNHKTHVKKKYRKTRLWSPGIASAVKECKQAWWKWRISGKPTSSKHPAVKRRVEAKRSLRKEQRRLACQQKITTIENIMKTKDRSKKFHSLIRNQRKTSQTTTKLLKVNGCILETTDEICDGWATHFQMLANNLENEHFDESLKNTFEEDVQHIQSICEKLKTETTPIEYDEVSYALKRLNTNKAADTMDLTSEHLKFGGTSVNLFLQDLLNHMIKQKHISPILKEGLLTPVFKKGDVANPSNYRGITVTSVILKVLEHIVNKRHNLILDESQSKLQKGFTTGQSSMNAALILSESVAESKNIKKPLILTTLDAQKAFDVVHHNSLLRKLYIDGITGDDWLLLQHMYTDLTSVVKWENTLSSPIIIRQGVRQGGVLSTTHYKRFNNPLLLQIEDRFSGATIGCINIPQVTCADDLALISHSSPEMQNMIDSVEDYAKRERYCINPLKSSVLTYKNSSKLVVADQKYYMNGKQISNDKQTTHLGIQRNVKNNADIEGKINLARKAAYSLMGAGLHSGNGLNQQISAKLWSSEIVPRLIFGLEVVDLKVKDINQLESFQRKCLKQIQGLPDKAPSSTALALLGIIPVETNVHKNMLTLFGSILRNRDCIEHEIAERQLAMKSIKEHSWFNKIKELLEKYNLPSAYALLSNTPTKLEWKKMINRALHSSIKDKWQIDVAEKSSLKYVNSGALTVGSSHPVWRTVHDNVHDSRRAQLKCRLLTGTYNLQSNRAVFNQHNVNPICKMCRIDPETRQHFLAECHIFETERDIYRHQIAAVTLFLNLDISNPEILTQVTLDCTRMVENPEHIDTIELASRSYIHKLHYKRVRVLSALERQQGFGDCG